MEQSLRENFNTLTSEVFDTLDPATLEAALRNPHFQNKHRKLIAGLAAQWDSARSFMERPVNIELVLGAKPIDQIAQELKERDRLADWGEDFYGRAPCPTLPLLPSSTVLPLSVIETSELVKASEGSYDLGKKVYARAKNKGFILCPEYIPFLLGSQYELGQLDPGDGTVVLIAMKPRSGLHGKMVYCVREEDSGFYINSEQWPAGFNAATQTTRWIFLHPSAAPLIPGLS